MKRTFILATFVVFLLGNFTSCKKQSCPVDEPGIKEILTRDMWKLIKMEEYDLNHNLTDLTIYHGEKMEFTPNDNFYFYNWDGNLNDAGTYSLLNDPSRLYIHSGGFDDTFTIDKIDENILILSLDSGHDKIILYAGR